MNVNFVNLTGCKQLRQIRFITRSNFFLMIAFAVFRWKDNNMKPFSWNTWHLLVASMWLWFISSHVKVAMYLVFIFLHTYFCYVYICISESSFFLNIWIHIDEMQKKKCLTFLRSTYFYLSSSLGYFGACY